MSLKIPEASRFPAARRGAVSDLRDIQLNSVFDELFAQYWSPITLLLVRLVGDADEAEDLALEAFYRLYKERDRSNSDHLVGWLYRVAMNLGLNALRANHRRRRYEQAAGQEALRSATSSGPVQETEANEEKRQVRSVLAQMKPQSAQLLFLRSAGLSYQELAEICRAPVGSIGTLLSRAERDFEKRYRARFGEGR